MVPPWVTASRFLAGNEEAFSSLLLFRVFLSCLFSWLPPQRYNTFECFLLGLLNNNNNIFDVEAVWVHWLDPCDRIILFVRKCIWNSLVLLVLPTFDDIGFLIYPQRRVVYCTFSTLVTAFRFFSGE